MCEENENKDSEYIETTAIESGYNSERFKHLWFLCENCETLIYKKSLLEQKGVCAECGATLQMTSSERIELLIDNGTWRSINTKLSSIDVLEKKHTTFDIKMEEFIETDEQSYQDYNTSYQKETGLPDAIQIGIGEINGIFVALGVMDFQFMGGSMGSVVGEKITRLIQFATKNFLPLILVCASGRARMQEGSFSLMQMNKIAAMLHTYQKEKNLLYISILTSLTTGGVAASFGKLANVTIVEPNACIAFVGKRVIEQTLNQIVDDEDQISDSLFDFGMFDSMVPRALLKNVLSKTIEIYMYGD
ncbi:acetyl-coenzyme A carboxylase carboxyl transferase subunit beta, chloroplastic-like [Cryptomeria japonica]|uniref:acetyl-coenzyme A carboxylase carboxyl transferase subunit beta, chloroplastic-like n=1 Tax=Cryptomeria japonica TaxID=3369 RepID=UPI0027DA5006|nr:acetyl-coenzyme A carboxylase carboxyl transferase subunit beta, chloroplastic-like [Cryptomeria japonica]